MAASDSNRTNQNAVLAARAVLGSAVAEDVAAEVVEAVRPHLERPYQIALQEAHRQLDALRAE